MKKFYSEPKARIIKVSNADIIATSGDPEGEMPGGGGEAGE